MFTVHQRIAYWFFFAIFDAIFLFFLLPSNVRLLLTFFSPFIVYINKKFFSDSFFHKRIIFFISFYVLIFVFFSYL